MIQPEGREVSLLLASGAVLPLTRRELRQVFNSRLLHGICLGLTIVSLAVLMFLSESFDLVDAAFTFFILLPLSIILTFVIYFGAIEVVLAFAKGRALLIPEPLISMVVSLLMVPFQIGLSLVVGFQPLMGTQLTLGNFFFFLIGMQVVVLSYAHFGRRVFVSASADPTEAAPSPAMEERLPRQVALGDVRVAPVELEMLEARDHYVAIVTLASETEIRARLKDLTDSLSAVPGRMVHRSVWISDAAVTGAKRQKDGLWLSLRSGRRVKVARPRQAEVEIWLRSGGML